MNMATKDDHDACQLVIVSNALKEKNPPEVFGKIKETTIQQIERKRIKHVSPYKNVLGG